MEDFDLFEFLSHSAIGPVVMFLIKQALATVGIAAAKALCKKFGVDCSWLG